MNTAGDILIVDDERTIVDLIADVLGDEGYAVRIAHDATQALRAIAERRPGLVLTDVRMPGVDGVTLLGVLRQHAGPAIPVVLMSADRQVLDTYRERVTGVLVKPFDLDTLLACVARYHLPLGMV